MLVEDRKWVYSDPESKSIASTRWTNPQHRFSTGLSLDEYLQYAIRCLPSEQREWLSQMKQAICDTSTPPSYLAQFAPVIEQVSGCGAYDLLARYLKPNKIKRVLTLGPGDGAELIAIRALLPEAKVVAVERNLGEDRSLPLVCQSTSAELVWGDYADAPVMKLLARKPWDTLLIRNPQVAREFYDDSLDPYKDNRSALAAYVRQTADIGGEALITLSNKRELGPILRALHKEGMSQPHLPVPLHDDTYVSMQLYETENTHKGAKIPAFSSDGIQLYTDFKIVGNVFRSQ